MFVQTSTMRSTLRPPNESLHFFVRLFDGRPVLELFPYPRRLIILSDHLGVNFPSRANRPVPQTSGHRRQRYTASEQMRAVGVPQRVQARALRQLRPAEQERYGRGEGVGLEGVPVRVSEYQIQVSSILWPVLAPELVLDLAVVAQRRDGRHWQADGARLLGFGAFYRATAWSALVIARSSPAHLNVGPA
jgi:hypothetical protein